MHSWLMNVNVHGRTRSACTHHVTVPVNTSRDGRQGSRGSRVGEIIKINICIQKCATNLFLYIAQQFLARLGLCQKENNDMAIITASHITSQHRKKESRVGMGGGGAIEKYRNIYVRTCTNTTMTRVPPIAPVQGCSGFPSLSFLFFPRQERKTQRRPLARRRADGVGGMRDVFPATKSNLSSTSCEPTPL